MGIKTGQRAATRFSSAKEIGQLIGQNAIDLLGHGAVAVAQAGFDVSDGHAHLGAHECARERRIYIADYDDPNPGDVRARLEGEHYMGGCSA